MNATTMERRAEHYRADGIADRVDDGVRVARRAIREGTRRAEDLAYDTAGRIRERPFGAVGAAFVAGAVVASAATMLALRPWLRSP